ncbi:MAG: multiheme c-type cytochrome [Planctomycetota bacterium]|nr:multiheme c-type cytochrome [Planctomycetota bacterium]
MTSSPAHAGLARPVLVGVVLGIAAIALAWFFSDRPEGEYEQYFPRANAETVAAWTEEWHRRGDAWRDVPDPAGEGPVVRARYWLARDRYDLEVRRRGDRVVVSGAGVAEHQFGGGWAAYGEGRITGSPRDFKGAVATFTWSCLGLRYRHASDGIGRIVFSEDGRACTTLYMAWEAPGIWAKSYGEVHAEGDEPPAYGAIKGQIPISETLSALPAKGRYRVRVRVRSTSGEPIAGALVQLKGQPATRVTSDAEGRGELAFVGAQAPLAQAFSAGALGYLNGETACLTGDAWPGLTNGALAPEEVLIELRPLELPDDASYAWNRASAASSPDDVMACGTCHPWHYDQWYESRHARMADNGHVTWEHGRMRAGDPAAPDDCVGCHQPAFAATAAPAGADTAWKPRGVMAGNHCDLCHKIQAVLDPRASGVFGAYKLARPGATGRVRPGGIHHVFGAAPDVTYAYMGASYNPLFTSSHLCAGCHQGGGRWRDGAPPKIDTFEEWKRWVAARPVESQRSCLDCHMAGAATVAQDGRPIDQMAWDALHRRPEGIHDHRFAGASAQMGELALRVEIEKRLDPDTGAWIAEVAVTNVGAGHKVPTGTWSKHVVVGV